MKPQHLYGVSVTCYGTLFFYRGRTKRLRKAGMGQREVSYEQMKIEAPGKGYG